jgi:DMSO/TMAO reductase YedYZ molybdopterin-dependent catalytic subunit
MRKAADFIARPSRGDEMGETDFLRSTLTRRRLLGQAGIAGLTAMAAPAWAQSIDLPLPGGPDERPLTHAFPQKGTMILQRTRPALLETPFEVFDKGVFTPNDQFFVRWHWALIPNSIDAASFRLNVRGRVTKPLSLSLTEIMRLPRFEIAAVNQCSGNSRGFFQPRVAGGEWGNGAMGNARWTGVRLKDVLDRAGVREGAVQVRFNGLDQAMTVDGPDFIKSLSVDHARDGEVMIAYAMNGRPLPLLNGFPLRLVVPGWYATYWMKMLNDIEVLGEPDTNFWMATAYTIPDTPRANMTPGQQGVKLVPINRMVPRSFITNVKAGATVPAGKPLALRGIAFGGDTGVKRVEVSNDGGKSWGDAKLGKDEGKYSFRAWTAHFTPASGSTTLMVRCTNTNDLAQPDQANWNPSGFMRNVVEATPITAS